MKLEDLIRENRENHYRLMVVFDNKNNPQAEKKVIEPLIAIGWQVIDVEKFVLELSENHPPDKLPLRFMDSFKEVIHEQFPDKAILINTDVLYSRELDSPDPIGTFKYRSREREMVLIVNDTLQNHYLQHAEYGDPDYKEIDLQDIVFIRVEDIDA